MTATFLDEFATINLDRAWLAPYLPIHQAFAKQPSVPLFQWLNSYFDDNVICLVNHHNRPLFFTHQNDLEHGTAYEAHIEQHQTIPTRDNLHDWFGACVWSVFPKTKALLNAKHLAHMHSNHGANGRNRLRDTITVFDENGAVLVVSDDSMGSNIARALAEFDWQTCLVTHRPYWAGSQVCADKKAKLFIFGHALLEQLINPYKSLCSHTVIVGVPPTFFEMTLSRQLSFLDDFLCYRLDKLLTDDVTPKDLHPLPILGVPHFWDNDSPSFYDDSFVFRSGRRR